MIICGLLIWVGIYAKMPAEYFAACCLLMAIKAIAAFDAAGGK